MRAALLSVCLLLIGSVAHAQTSRKLRIRLDGCSAWSERELARLALLELETVGGGESDAGSADVAIECSPLAITMTAREAFGKRALSRKLELADGAEDAQHLLAISIAQLVRALDWLPEPPAAPEPEPARVPAREPERPQVGPTGPRAVELHVAVGPRGRQLGPAPTLTTLRAELGTGFALAPGVRVGGAFSVERGDTAREAGLVRADLLGVALQAGYEPWRGQRWSCLLQLELAVQHLTLTGRHAAADVAVGRARGFGVESELGLGPVVRWKDVGVGLLAQGGAATFGGRGLVSNDDPVSMNGVWAGTELLLMWAP